MAIKEKIKNNYFSFKKRIAEALQRKTETLSVQKKKLLLFLFCLFFAGMSVIAIVNAFVKKSKPVAIQKLPALIQQHEAPAMPFISKQEFERIEKFKKQVYALPKETFDSFMQTRPKLMDSITAIEHYYQTQK